MESHLEWDIHFWLGTNTSQVLLIFIFVPFFVLTNEWFNSKRMRICSVLGDYQESGCINKYMNFRELCDCVCEPETASGCVLNVLRLKYMFQRL